MTTPLLAVTLLFQSKALSELRHVVEGVSAYLDASVELPLHKACRFNSLKLLDRIWNSHVPDNSWSVRRLLGGDEEYMGNEANTDKDEYKECMQYQFTQSLAEAGRLDNLEMVQWLFRHLATVWFVGREAVAAAAEAGAMDILEFYHRYDSNRDDLAAVASEENEEVSFHEFVWSGAEVKAAMAGRADIALWILNNMSYVPHPGPTLKAAVACGSVELTEHIADGGVPLKGFHEAAANGHMRMINWRFDQGFASVQPGVLLRAAENGRLAIVRSIIEHDWIDENRESDNGRDDDSSDDYGYDPYRYNRRDNDSTRYTRMHITCVDCEASLCIHAAAINGHLEVAKYLRACVDTPLNKRDRKSEKRSLGSLYIALKKEIGGEHNAQRVSAETMLLAAKRGHFDVVQWLYEEFAIDPSTNLFWVHRFDYKNEFYESAIDAAAGNGHVEIVQYLHQKGQEAELDAARGKPVSLRKRKRDIDFFDFDESSDDDTEDAQEPTKPGCSTRAMDEAAAHNHMHVVQWLHENRTEGCTTDAMDSAALNGHLEMVKWLHDRRKEGCTAKAMDGAAGGGHLAVVKWLHEQSLAGCTVKAMDRAAIGGHLDVVKWLHENRTEGCAMDGAAACGALDVVKFLHKNRSEGCTTKAMDLAAQNGHIRVVRWLHENRSEGCTTRAMDGAARNGHFEMVIMLRTHRKEGCTAAVSIPSVSRPICVWLAEQYPDVVDASGLSSGEESE